jgi:hypothetical protein
MLVAFHVLCIIWIAVLFWFYAQIAHLASVNSGSRPKLGPANRHALARFSPRENR